MSFDGHPHIILWNLWYLMCSNVNKVKDPPTRLLGEKVKYASAFYNGNDITHLTTTLILILLSSICHMFCQ